MEFNLKASAEHVNAIFAGLNKLEHGAVRQTFDHLLKQVQEQEMAAVKPAAPEANTPAGLTD